MGMYTELIFGATLKKETPKDVIHALKYMLGEADDKPDNFPLPVGRCEWLFRGSSCYFGVNAPFSDMIFDDVLKKYVISTRSNIKNYEGEIETFLEWIKPYIDQGSGKRGFYAIVTYEEANEPHIYYLH